MLNSTQQFVYYLEEHCIKYTLNPPMKNGMEVVKVLYNGENMSSIDLRFFFGSDETDAAVRVFDLVKVPHTKTEAVLSALNELNNTYRFAKFCFREDDRTVQLEADCIFRTTDVGPIVGEMLARCLNICDEAYPQLMKAVYA